MNPSPIQSSSQVSVPVPSKTDTKDTNLKKLRESCRQFEAIFIKQMYDSMHKSLPDDGLIPKSNATNLYQDMLNMQMAQKTASDKGIGIGEAMYNQMKVHVEGKK